MVSAKPNEIDPVVCVSADLSPRFCFQANVLSVTVIPHDAYNQGSPSASILPLYVGGAGLVLGTLGGVGRGLPSVLPDSSLPRTVFRILAFVVMVPALMANSEYHLNLVAIDSMSTSRVFPSVFCAIQTDYFVPRGARWLRIGPSAGAELLLRFNDDIVSFDRIGFAIGLRAGISRHWDYLHDSIRRSPYFGFAGLKFLFNV